ncbi:MAG TPA: trypsin-like peptidase domain-containing protein [Planctomycetota bacterium]|nr:trypsin-like peptidase domain-containing protein [Planctomycetota bacterium]
MLAAVLAACFAQQPYADAYSFAEREPRTPLERAIDAVLPCVVKVHGASGLATVQPYGSGVIVSEQGHVLALDQVMLQDGQTSVVLWDGSVHAAELLPPDEKLGVRMLKIDCGRPLPFLKPAADLSPPPGTIVFSVGNCFRLAEFSEKLSVTSGVLVARAKTGLRYRLQDVDYDGELWITDAMNNPGHGGGGLFTLDGKWIGLNAKVVTSRETNTHISAAIPVADLVPYIERWTLGKVAPPEPPAAPAARGWIGVKLFDHGSGQTSPPAYVERVVPGSPAALAGIKPDDLIVHVDGQPVRTCRQFHEAAAKLRPGQKVAITYKRGASVHKVELTLGEEKR